LKGSIAKGDVIFAAEIIGRGAGQAQNLTKLPRDKKEYGSSLA
jgi:hypothetical protein